jgi:hypothetical protein
MEDPLTDYSTTTEKNILSITNNGSSENAIEFTTEDKFSNYLIISQLIGFLLNLILIFIKYFYVNSKYFFILIDFLLVFYFIFSNIYILIKLNEIEKKL